MYCITILYTTILQQCVTVTLKILLIPAVMIRHCIWMYVVLTANTYIDILTTEL